MTERATRLALPPPSAEPPRLSVVNAGDPYGARLAAEIDGAVTFAVGAEADYRAEDLRCGFAGCHFRLITPESEREVSLPMPGHFNVANALGVEAIDPIAWGLVQDRLGLNCPAMDLQAACAGFMYALITGAAYIVSGASSTALIVGGDCNSRILNPTDIKTYPLFGDGAGALVLTRGRPDQGLLSFSLGSDGGGGDLLSRPACGSRLPPARRGSA